MVPSYGTKLNDNPEALAEEWAFTNAKLQLAIEPPSLHPVDPNSPDLNTPAGEVHHVSDMAL
jgi:malate dehydrogenase (quinone)